MIWSVTASLIPIELVSNADYDLVSFCLIPIPIELTLNADYGTSVIASLSLNFSFQAVYNNLQALDYMLMMSYGLGAWNTPQDHCLRFQFFFKVG